MRTPITTHNLATIDTDPPIRVERFSDDTPGDSWECVTLTIGNTVIDLPLGEADELSRALTQAVATPPPDTPSRHNGQ